MNPSQGLFVVPGNHDCRIKGVWQRKVLKSVFDKQFHDYFQSRFFPSLHLLICCFDSNTADWQVNAATGFVEQQEFIAFRDWLTNAKKAINLASLTKIALLHHHPMPIAETESTGKYDVSQFMILRNAATFMQEALEAEIDLILHGHQHMIGYSRASFRCGHDMRDISVLAAGSAGETNEGNYQILQRHHYPFCCTD